MGSLFRWWLEAWLLLLLGSPLASVLAYYVQSKRLKRAAAPDAWEASEIRAELLATRVLARGLFLSLIAAVLALVFFANTEPVVHRAPWGADATSAEGLRLLVLTGGVVLSGMFVLLAAVVLRLSSLTQELTVALEPGRAGAVLRPARWSASIRGHEIGVWWSLHSGREVVRYDGRVVSDRVSLRPWTWHRFEADEEDGQVRYAVLVCPGWSRIERNDVVESRERHIGWRVVAAANLAAGLFTLTVLGLLAFHLFFGSSWSP